jgi:cytochrome P450
VPFNGGSRLCLGKTQAELNMRTFIIFISQMFDFAFEEKDKYLKPDDYPIFAIFVNKKIPVPVQLYKRKFE